MLFLSVLTLFQLSAALPSLHSRASQYLVVLDTGVGHRSTPIPIWPTSLRRINIDGTNAANLTQFGVVESDPNTLGQPILAYALTYSPSTSSLFSVTGRGVARTNLDGGNLEYVLTKESGASSQIVSITVAEQSRKLYYGDSNTGLIYSSNYDGSNVAVFRNVSQGLTFLSKNYSYANTHAGGIVVDEARGWLYWSSASDGSIRRVLLSGEGQEQVLVTGVDKPGQLRIAGTSLFFAERGSWSSSPTAIKYLDRMIDELPASPTSPNLAVPTDTLISSAQSSLFTEVDYTGEKQTLGIESFVIYRNGVEQIVYFAVNSAGRTSFGKIVETVWRGSGGSRGPVFKVLNADTRDVGIPVGLEHIF
ncbi:hypothetical protein COCC4DRAFT_147951 [Bipolaris maydis ATCC 48331]|uniref:SMP-30/Gluconolactonase/LRE-like region domain-containing protein n=2 Tax=Cochliobolus heterostrophus TaxID=5016 RepID=M2VBS9_COCH5|nr:uncharacterized protein COCC4DRAFT_147951 [Bipolaris maydis ATCC 48331]EMD97382.1 hypothetical protein COCHEDRAFT_1164223 [Bipolaris maydis C5]KAJ5020779.1 hypothetical protein J3E73DRAFT_221649 [Bipolaris maydis]ENI01476.1 hypothetical protein COCC4DRAFT_147951 [Bipolaris maydis ATCC 48331]KAJ5031157.1 hypothetical protein J3E73DRAFT_377233 [Bipolaris maydis]KAJ5052848.1 hypothetical protein J3E74DRAFT_469435 [Bipolaris maydis]